MVKVFALIPRRDDVTREFFHEHWSGPHAELALRITTLLRYVQSHRTGPALPGVPEPVYEGVAEVWFTDVATAAGMGEDPDYVEGAHADEPTFIDLDRLAFVICDEDVVRAGGPVAQDDPGAKALLLLRGDAAGLGERLGQAAPAARRITVATAVSEMYADGAQPAYDAVAELWFADAGEALTALGGGALAGALDGLAAEGLLVEEQRVLWPEPVRG